MGSAENAAAVGDALRATADQLGPWIGAKVVSWPADKGGHVSPHDPAYLIAVLLDARHATFGTLLSEQDKANLYRLRDIRNRWAHMEPFDDARTREALDVCRRVQAAIGRVTTSVSDH